MNSNSTTFAISDFTFLINHIKPLEVEFAAPVIDNLVTYEWNFGDPNSKENVSTGYRVKHKYSQEGIYHVSLQIKSDDGSHELQSLSKEIVVRSHSGEINWTQAMLVLLMLLAVSIGGLLGLSYSVAHIGKIVKVPEILLPIEIIGSVLLMLVVLVLTSIVFRALNLSNPNLALALPEGTIRSVIALSLILIYTVSVLYLSREIENTYTYQVQGDEQLSQVLATLDDGTTIINIDRQEVAGQIDSDNADADKQSVYTLRVLAESSKEKVDFAKQILTTISTLLVAIVGFYFGSRAGSTTSDVAGSQD